ncbi:MAG: DUF882 domain-containing protein [Rhodospirillaceae bacterium]
MTNSQSFSLPSRRAFISGGFAMAASVALPTQTFAGTPPRTLSFENLHTGERLKATYWADGEYLPEAALEIRRVLRDHRTDAIHTIDPNLLDLLVVLQQRLEITQAYQVISCYRSPQTNAALAKVSDGVATRSLHMLGAAIDVRIGRINLHDLKNAARSLGAGGVGFYPQSNFVHLDTGRPRYW